jgi:hypothetical protein
MCRKRIGAILRDWPGVTTGCLAGIVVVHSLVAKYANWPWMLKSYITETGASAVDSQVASAVYLGLSAIAAISAGFAGVIIVFGLTSESKVFRDFRRASGERLSVNWTSVIASAFLSSASSLAAALAQLLDRPFVANMLFEFGCLLLLHSAVRSVWVLRLLLRLVSVDDRKRIGAEQTERLGNPFGKHVSLTGVVP